MIYRVTIDTNCLIDVEEGREGCQFITRLKELNDAGIIKLRIPAIIASEKRINGKQINHFDEFKEFLQSIGFGDLEILLPQFYWGVTFWGYGIWNSGEKGSILEDKLQNILFPGFIFNYVDYCTANHITDTKFPVEVKWRNKKCDVLMIWSHIYHDGEAFVTRDSNFHKQEHKEALVALRVGKILLPKDACDIFTTGHFA